MTGFPVNPELLTWARECAGVDTLALAGRFPELGEWEAGELQPTLRQVEGVACGVVKSLVHEHQAAYYAALQTSTAQTDSAPFVAFMLDRTLDSLVTAAPQVAPQVTPQVTPQVERLLLGIDGEMSREALQQALHLRDRKSFRERYLKPALDQGLIEMSVPDKPNSRLQRYRLTDRGRLWLEQRKDP